MSPSETPYAVGVVLAAGMGTRVGADGNKAYLRVAGRSMVTWSMDTLGQVPGIERVILVFRRGERQLAEATVASELPNATVEFVEGGTSRHASEFNVLCYLADDISAGAVDVVLIHDGARPATPPRLFDTALAAAREFGGAIPAVTVPDVVTTATGTDIASVPAGTIVRVQTPQAFRAQPLLEAYRQADRDGFEGTDTASCVQRYTDVEIHAVEGSHDNLKVTYARDIPVAERLLTYRDEVSPP